MTTVRDVFVAWVVLSTVTDVPRNNVAAGHLPQLLYVSSCGVRCESGSGVSVSVPNLPGQLMISRSSRRRSIRAMAGGG